MPSIITNHFSEPVTLATSDTSPYEPPHRTSHEKPSRRSSSTTGTLLNGFAVDGSGTSKKIDGVFFKGPKGANTSLTSLPNDRPSDSTDGRRKTHSRHGSDLSIGSGLNASTEIEERTTPSINGITKQVTASESDPMAQGNGALVQPSRPKSPEKGQIGGGHRGHARAHSLSAPQTLSPTLAPSSPREGAMQDFGAHAAAPNNPQLHNNRTHISANPPNTAPNPAIALGSSKLSLQPTAPRLQHRHTLQVPRLATGRVSKDFSSPVKTSSEDMDVDIERFSPTHGGGRGSTSLGRRPTRSIHSDMYLDEIPQDGDMARWTETIKQKRASRRQRKEEEEDDRVVVGTKVDMHHVNWVTAYNMLTGIRFTVSRTNAKIDRELTDADFDARHKFSFDITGNELTPSAKYDFKFKDYAPWVFRHLRAKFMLDPADYLMSLTSKYILSELGSPGKSGSFFYFSRDYKYIIKTIHHAEHKLLRRILRDYWAHIDKNPNTLISQFYGLHRVKIPYGRKIHFVVMNNLFPPHRDIHQTFDLKGSTIGRDFREADLEKNPRATLKDLNWLRRNYHFEFGPRKKSLFIEQMKRDVALLQRLKIMDYSLLVGIHDLSKGNEENLRDKTLQVFQPGGEHDAEPQPNMLSRTPSKLEHARKARELRQIIKREKPVPMDKSTSKMPDEMLEERKNFIFYSDDGGFRATHEDGQPGEEIYYLGIIDCLTHYGFVKRAENFWKGMSNPKTQISPIPPESYGERFIRFISGLALAKEEQERGVRSSEQLDGPTSLTAPSTGNRKSSVDISRKSIDKVIEKAEKQARKSEEHGATEDERRDRTLSAMRSPSAERTNGVAGATLPVVEEDGEATSREDSLSNEKSPAATYKADLHTKEAPRDSSRRPESQREESLHDGKAAAVLEQPAPHGLQAKAEAEDEIRSIRNKDGDKPPPTPEKDLKYQSLPKVPTLPPIKMLDTPRALSPTGFRDGEG